MNTQLKLGDLAVDVVLKDIKNVHLSVHPPTGRVRIAAPPRTSLHTLRVFAISKLGWIKKQRKKLREQERETPREYIDRESHYVWGRRVLLKVVEADSAPSVLLRHATLLLRVRPGTDETTRQAVVASRYRQLVRTSVPPLIEAWKPRLKVTVNGFHVQQMKTK